MQSFFNVIPVGLVGTAAYFVMLFFIDQSLTNKKQRRLFRAVSTFLGNFGLIYAFTRLAPAGTNALKLNISQGVLLVGCTMNAIGSAFFLDAFVGRSFKTHWRIFSVALFSGTFFWVLHKYVPDYRKCVEFTKLAISIVAIFCVFFETHRKGQGRPVAEKWKKLVGVSLAIVGISVYFNGYKFGYPKYYHRWDQYHYYMGAKYFPELGYKNLYKCAVVAQDDVGKLTFHLDRPFNGTSHPSRTVDMKKEMRDPDKKIRDLPGENLLVPIGPILDSADECRNAFSKDRWEEYKGDVAFYRIVSGKGYWTDMQKDHGFNPPPVWTVAGKFFSDLSPASVRYLQFLASLDILYLLGMFIALWWGFGWRVFAVGAIFWGCQSSAPFYWTGGAFLRQDWLFFSVLSVACLRKRHFKIAGAALVYAGLLRVFPGLVVIGTLVPTVIYAIKHKKMHKDHLQMLIGGTAAAALLLVVSSVISARPNTPFYEPYKLFYEHTIETHDKTPLTNHMGLRVIMGHKFFKFQKPGLRSAEEREQFLKNTSWARGRARVIAHGISYVKLPIGLATGKESGQMQYAKDAKKLDPFEDWKRMRNERYEKYKIIAYGLMLATMAFFVWVVGRMKSLWIAQCLGQIFIILGSQLTCYYYSFMILAAPLIKVRKQIELGLFALAGITQAIWLTTYWNDNRYTLLTIASLIYCYVMLYHFSRPLKPGKKITSQITSHNVARANK